MTKQSLKVVRFNPFLIVAKKVSGQLNPIPKCEVNIRVLKGESCCCNLAAGGEKAAGCDPEGSRHCEGQKEEVLCPVKVEPGRKTQTLNKSLKASNPAL